MIKFAFKKEKNNNQFLFDEVYVKYLIAQKLFERDMEYNELFEYVNSLYVNGIKSNSFKQFIDNNFNKNKYVYSLKSKQKEALILTNKVIESLFNKNKYFNDTINEFSKNLYPGKDYFLTIIRLYTELVLEKEPANVINHKIYNSLLKYDMCFDEYFNILGSVDEQFLSIPISAVFYDDNIIKLLLSSNIMTLDDLIGMEPHKSYNIIACNLEENLSLLSGYSFTDVNQIKNTCDRAFVCLKERDKDVILRRNQYGKKETLNSIGEEYGLTRERVRQIQNKAYKIIKESNNNLKGILNSFYYFLKDEKKEYLNYYDIKKALGDQYYVKYCLLSNLLCENLESNTRLGYIYDPKIVDLNSILSDSIKKLGCFISKERYESLDDYYKCIVDEQYKDEKDIYIQKGFTKNDLVLKIIDERLDSVYRKKCDNEKISSIFFEEYGIKISDSAIKAHVERSNKLCLIDNGTYTKYELVNHLPSEEIEIIINKIIKDGKSIYYRTVYEKNKDLLLLYGIRNRYHLKSEIDLYLPRDYKAKKDYISQSKNFVSMKDTMIGFVKKQKGLFAISDLMREFPKLEKYTYDSVIYGEYENGLLLLGNNNYIYESDILNLDKLKLKECIEESFVEHGTDFLSTRSILKYMQNKKQDVLESISPIDNEQGLFSLIKYIFKDLYSFARPYISKNKDKGLKHSLIVCEYVSRLYSFNNKTVSDFTNSNNLRFIYSYLQFMENMSDTFVQVSKDTMVNKEKLGIDEKILLGIKEIIYAITLYYNKLDTRDFSGYANLPNVGLPWNKYLLVGIVRTYFSDMFKIENTESTYDKTDFIISIK